MQCYPQGLLPSQDAKGIPEPVFETPYIHDMLRANNNLY